MSDDNKTQNDALLFTEREVAGYTVKSLSYGELSAVTPELVHLFEQVAPILKETFAQSPNTLDMCMLIFRIVPHAGPAIAKIVGASTEEINALPANEGVLLANAIWETNQELLTSFFGIIGKQAQGM